MALCDTSDHFGEFPFGVRRPSQAASIVGLLHLRQHRHLADVWKSWTRTPPEMGGWGGWDGEG